MHSSRTWFSSVTACLVSWAVTGALENSAAANWPQFRGPGGLGIAEGAPPVVFGMQSNLVWRVELPPGNSSPIVWGTNIFLTGCPSNTLETLCLDAETGRVRWRKAAPQGALESTHRLGNPATPTPITDGERVWVYFGSFGLICYGADGAVRWQKPLPLPVVEFGGSTSPILAGDCLILNCDQDLGSYLLALDARTGETRWRVDRAQFRRGFSTPFVWRHGGAEELIVPGSLWLKSYSLVDGAELWTVSGTSRVACSSPVALGDWLFSASWNIGGDAEDRVTMPDFDETLAAQDRNHDGQFSADELPAGPVRERFTQMDLNKDGLVTREEWKLMAEMFTRAGNALLAIRAGGRGDITTSHVAWRQTRSLPYVASPLCYAGRVYTVKNGGLVSCYDAATGKVHFQDERLGAAGDYYASPVAAGGHIYFGSQAGIVTVLAAGDTLQIMARNDLGEPLLASPAIVDGTMFIRTETHLHAFRSGS